MRESLGVSIRRALKYVAAYNAVWFAVCGLVASQDASSGLMNFLRFINPPFYLYNKSPHPFEKAFNFFAPGFSSGILAVASIVIFAVVIIGLFWGIVGVVLGFSLNKLKTKRV